MRELLGPDEIGAAHRSRIRARGRRHLVHQPLGHKDPDAHADPAIGAERTLIGGHGQRGVGVGGDAVGAGEDLHRPHRLEDRRHREGRVRSGIGDHVGAQPEDAAVAVRRHRRFDRLLPGVRHGQQVLSPVLDPLDRPRQEAGDRAGDEILGVERHLGAKPAADVRNEHADARLREAQESGQAGAEDVGELRRGPDGEPAPRFPSSRDAAPFQRNAREPLVAKRSRNDHGGRGERALHVPQSVGAAGQLCRSTGAGPSSFAAAPGRKSPSRL